MLLRDGEQVALHAKTFDLLAYKYAVRFADSRELQNRRLDPDSFFKSDVPNFRKPLLFQFSLRNVNCRRVTCGLEVRLAASRYQVTWVRIRRHPGQKPKGRRAIKRK